MDEQKRLLTAEEFGKLLGMNKDQVYYFVRANIIQCVRFGKKSVRFEPSEVDRLIKYWKTRKIVVPKVETKEEVTQNA